MDRTPYIKFLKEYVKPADGCTEIVAVGLATSAAFGLCTGNVPRTLLNERYYIQSKTGSDTRMLSAGTFGQNISADDISSIHLYMDKNLFKNAFGVAIPHTNTKKGISLAAALGIYLNINRYYLSDDDPGYMRIYEQITPAIIENAEKLRKKVSVSIIEDSPEGYRYIRNEDYRPHSLYLRGEIIFDTRGEGNDEDDKGSVLNRQSDDDYLNSAVIVLYGHHDNIYFARSPQSKYVLKRFVPERDASGGNGADTEKHLDLSWEGIWNGIENLSEDEKKLLRINREINLELVNEGLKDIYGLGIVKAMKAGEGAGIYGNTIFDKIRLYVAAGVEARMGGAPKPAMATSGSGNQGLIAIVPLIVYTEEKHLDDDILFKAMLLSHLIVHRIAVDSGELSPLCGAMNKAAFGAAAGLTLLMGGDRKAVENSLKIIASNSIGMICDGAKFGCTFKALTAVTAAYEAAYFAAGGMDIPADGFVEDSVDKLFENIGLLSERVRGVDDAVIDLLHRRSKD